MQEQLLSDALDIDRIVRGQLTLTWSDHDLVAVVAEVLDTMRPAAIEKGIAIVEQVSGSQADCSCHFLSLIPKVGKVPAPRVILRG